jgi:hypothetical protein
MTAQKNFSPHHQKIKGGQDLISAWLILISLSMETVTQIALTE